MKRNLVALLFASALFTCAHAQDRDAKIRMLIDAQGITESFEQQLVGGRKFAREQGEAVLKQLTEGMTPTSIYRERLEAASTSYFSRLASPWTAQEMAEIWVRYYGESFSEREIEGLLSYYQSPLAQKEVIAARAAQERFSNYFRAKALTLLEEATKQYRQDLQIIQRDCNCMKKQ